MPRLIFTLLSLFAVSAVGAGVDRAYTYNSIQVINDTQQTLTGVTIEDTTYGRERSCGDIEPMRTCTLWFGNRLYQHNPLRVSWAEGGAERQTEELELDIPLTLAPGPTLRGLITVTSDGSLSTSADQPNRK